MPDKVEILTTKIPVAYLGYTNVGACIWPTWQKMSKLHMCDIAIIHVFVLCDTKNVHVTFCIDLRNTCQADI